MSNDIQKMSQDFQHRVREAAYFMWEAAGRPVGMAMQFWAEAEQQVFKTMQVATEAMMPGARDQSTERSEPAEAMPSKKPAASAEPKKAAKSASSGKQSGKTEKAAASSTTGKKQNTKPAAKSATKPAGKSKKTATTKKS